MRSRQLREKLRTQHGMGEMVGDSPEMEKLYRILVEGGVLDASGVDPGRERTGKRDGGAVDPYVMKWA